MNPFKAPGLPIKCKAMLDKYVLIPNTEARLPPGSVLRNSGIHYLAGKSQDARHEPKQICNIFPNGTMVPEYCDAGVLFDTAEERSRSAREREDERQSIDCGGDVAIALSAFNRYLNPRVPNTFPGYSLLGMMAEGAS